MFAYELYCKNLGKFYCPSVFVVFQSTPHLFWFVLPISKDEGLLRFSFLSLLLCWIVRLFCVGLVACYFFLWFWVFVHLYVLWASRKCNFYYCLTGSFQATKHHYSHLQPLEKQALHCGFRQDRSFKSPCYYQPFHFGKAECSAQFYST